MHLFADRKGPCPAKSAVDVVRTSAYVDHPGLAFTLAAVIFQVSSPTDSVLRLSFVICGFPGDSMSAQKRTPQPAVSADGPDILTVAQIFTGSVMLRRIPTVMPMAIVCLVLLLASNSTATTNIDKHNRQRLNRPSRGEITHSLKRSQMKQAEFRLAEMGYETGRVDGVIDDSTRNALIVFQKWEGLKITGRLRRADFDAIMSAEAPRAKDPGYRHVEVDLDRQVLLLIDDDGTVQKILPVSSGSNKQYKEKRMSGLAYTPRGRFRIESKIAGWRKSPLGLLYYPNYFSGGLAIHGNPSVPHNPQSHGCVRIPMSAAIEMSRDLPVGTILLIYDKQSFVSAKDWDAADKQKQEASIR